MPVLITDYQAVVETFLPSENRNLRHRIVRKGEFLNRFPSDKMFLDNYFQNFWCTRVIPRPLGVNHGDGTLSADAKAVRFGAINQRVRADQVQFFQPFFEKFPGLKALLFWRAFSLGRVRAEENMPAIFFEAERFHELIQFVHGSGGRM